MAKVSEKSTKTDIWAAYQALLAELENRPTGISGDAAKLDQLVTSLNETKEALLSDFQPTIERLMTIRANYETAEQELSKRKAGIIEEIEAAKREVMTAVAEARKQHQREEDEYGYNLNIKRRDEEQAYQAQRKERETVLDARTANLAENKA